MLSFFTIPKPFAGHIGVIQRNALASWRAVLPGAEIVVFGDEPGAGDAAAAVGARFVPDVERNEYGTPLLGSTFRRLAESDEREGSYRSGGREPFGAAPSSGPQPPPQLMR